MSMEKNEEYELEELRNQVALLTRYVRVLQDKVRELEGWRMSQNNTPRTATFSDGGPRQSISMPVDGSPLGKSISDITRYPVAPPRQDEK